MGELFNGRRKKWGGIHMHANKWTNKQQQKTHYFKRKMCRIKTKMDFPAVKWFRVMRNHLGGRDFYTLVRNSGPHTWQALPRWKEKRVVTSLKNYFNKINMIYEFMILKLSACSYIHKEIHKNGVVIKQWNKVLMDDLFYPSCLQSQFLTHFIISLTVQMFLLLPLLFTSFI